MPKTATEVICLADIAPEAPIKFFHANFSRLGREKGFFHFHPLSEIHTGKLSCFRPGISTVLPRSIASARAMRERVACGMITSSI